MSQDKILDLSVVVTAHVEGILAHRTLASVFRAVDELGDKYTSEIILHLDNPTNAMLEYVAKEKPDALKNIVVFTNNFGDPGLSRNFAIEKARGKYIAIIDADDLMSRNWLRQALETLNKSSEPTVAHSEVTVEFEGVDSLVIKYGEIDRDTDALLSVFANRWNAVIVAPRDLLIEEPYMANSVGYGYEDWHLNNRLIARGVHNVLIPHTAIFVRRKKTNSVWAQHTQAAAVLRANPLLSFENMRRIPLGTVQKSSSKYSYKGLKRYVAHIPLAKRTFHKLRSSITKRHLATPQSLPSWLSVELSSIHAIERQLFTKQLTIYESITPDHYKAGEAYKLLVDQTKHNSYDYLLLIPWLVKGGADSYSINLVNTIKSQQPNSNILVVATLNHESPWSDKLDGQIDFVEFGKITQELSPQVQMRVFEQFIENSGAKYLHIINSELAYDFVREHPNYIKDSDKVLVATSFSQSIDPDGRIYGYSHTHVPFVYEQCTVVCSDNQAVLNMWRHDYGFNPSKLLLVHPTVDIRKDLQRKNFIADGVLHVLWAARLSPEKQPEIVIDIANRLLDLPVKITMYGAADPSFSTTFLKKLPSNVTYKGSFDGFYSIKPEQYDLYLYTSLFDGMPNTILEAGSIGMPIISSNVGGIPEIIKPDENGLLINNDEGAGAFAEKIRKIIDNPNVLTKFSDKIIETVSSEFSGTAYETSVQNLLRKIKFKPGKDE